MAPRSSASTWVKSGSPPLRSLVVDSGVNLFPSPARRKQNYSSSAKRFPKRLPVFPSLPQTRDALGKFVRRAIVHYRDDLDLQNLMDYIQKEVRAGELLRPHHARPSRSKPLFFSKQPSRKPQRLPAYVIFGLADSFPHDVLNVTSASCSLRVSPLRDCTSICARWHTNPGFPGGRSPDGRGWKARTVFLGLHLLHALSLFFPVSPQFKCCGWNNYTDWSWNLYFNCTPGNPSSERCGVPYSCCTPVPGEVPARRSAAAATS